MSYDDLFTNGGNIGSVSGTARENKSDIGYDVI